MNFPSLAEIPTSHLDPINSRILSISEDRIQWFEPEPFRYIAERAGVELHEVLLRLRAMLQAGTIRRIRQTLMTTSLAEGALVAWRVPENQLDAAFEFLLREDPFTGHVVIRSTEAQIPGAAFKLWTTLKVPVGLSMEEHCRILQQFIGADAFRIMPAKGIFALGVGHTRRRNLKPGDKAPEPAQMTPVQPIQLTQKQWRFLSVLKREFTPEEIQEPAWAGRAQEIGLSLDEFYSEVEKFKKLGLLGRFSTFLEHVKPTANGERVTRFNALFHWAVPPGYEQKAGGEIGRHEILTHCYWREAGPEFFNVNIMAVAHGTEKQTVLAHKEAIDEHLKKSDIPVLYTNVFWGGRSEIKPSELCPFAYSRWREKIGAPVQITLPA